MGHALVVAAWVLAYLAGYFPVARRMYITFDTEDDDSDFSNMVGAAFFSLFWPAYIPVVLVKFIAFRETPRQRRVRETAERAATERVAARYELPMPGIEVRQISDESTRGSGYRGTT